MLNHQIPYLSANNITYSVAYDLFIDMQRLFAGCFA